MNIAIVQPASLPSLVTRAAQALASATTAAEILEAKELANEVIDAAKRAARIAKAKGAFDELQAAIYRAQADALEIEALAKRRLADEYDAAQERGEVVGPRGGGDSTVPARNAATAADLGLSRKDIHEARLVRDAEIADPGIVRRVLDQRVEAREEPTKAALREAVTAAAMRGLRSAPVPSRKNPVYVPPSPEEKAWQHLYGVCRALNEWATDGNRRLAYAGLKKADGRQWENYRAVHDCYWSLQEMLIFLKASIERRSDKQEGRHAE